MSAEELEDLRQQRTAVERRSAAFCSEVRVGGSYDVKYSGKDMS
jgi:hypothetical protein